MLSRPNKSGLSSSAITSFHLLSSPSSSSTSMDASFVTLANPLALLMPCNSNSLCSFCSSSASSPSPAITIFKFIFSCSWRRSLFSRFRFLRASSRSSSFSFSICFCIAASSSSSMFLIWAAGQSQPLVLLERKHKNFEQTKPNQSIDQSIKLFNQSINQ